MNDDAHASEDQGKPAFGAYIGRFSPMHLGHEHLIRAMLKEFGENHLVLIGSCSHEISFRHLFSLTDRTGFMRQVFPDARIVGLPDFDTDDDWFHQLDSTLTLAGADPNQVVFAGGCVEDISFFVERGRKTHILNRFSGETPRVSATEVRDALIEHRPITGLVNDVLVDPITEQFRKRWAALRKK